MNFSLISGSILAVLSGFCYFLIPFPMANRNLNTYLIGAFLGSVALKVFEVFLLAGSLVSLNSMDLNNALTVVRADPFQMPYIAISAASSLLLGILIIFIGLALRKGKLMTIPQKEEEKF